MNEAVIGLIGAIFGGAGIKLIEAYVLPRAKQVDIATTIRDELRDEIKGYKQEVKDLRSELDEWKTKYFSLLEIIAKHNINIPDDLKK